MWTYPALKTGLHHHPYSSKEEHLMTSLGYFFQFFHTCICFGYSLEAPPEALLMSTHNIWRINENYSRIITKYFPLTSQLLKRGVFDDNSGIIFLVDKNICLWVLIKAPQQVASNESPQHMFLRRTEKNYPRIITK